MGVQSSERGSPSGVLRWDISLFGGVRDGVVPEGRDVREAELVVWAEPLHSSQGLVPYIDRVQLNAPPLHKAGVCLHLLRLLNPVCRKRFLHIGRLLRFISFLLLMRKIISQITQLRHAQPYLIDGASTVRLLIDSAGGVARD